MQAHTFAYHGSTTGTRLVAAALALAGSGAMIAGNLGIAAYYAANFDTGQSLLASRDHAPGQTAAIKCDGKAS